MALSELEETKIKYDVEYDFIYKLYFLKNGNELKPTEFLRSAVFKLNAFDEENADSVPIAFNININYIFSNSDYDNF